MLLVAAVGGGALVALRLRDGGGGGGGTGSDEAYVRAVCIATKKFSDQAERYLDDRSLQEDDEKLSRAIAGPLRTYVDRMAAAKPPADAREYHRAIVGQLRTLLAAAERGEFIEALSELRDDPELPPEVEARLAAIAETIKDCEDVGFFG